MQAPSRDCLMIFSVAVMHMDWILKRGCRAADGLVAIDVLLAIEKEARPSVSTIFFKIKNMR